MDTTIVICYQAGTSDMLKVCLEAISWHTERPVSIIVATVESDDGLEALQREFGFEVKVCDVCTDIVNRIHGLLLDKVIPDAITTPFFITLDSDCFPVGGGWLAELHGMMEKGARIAGVLHPWGPPPEDLPKTKMAYRIRSQHCWESTHVACQMLRTDDYRELQEHGVRFSGGYDTGLLVPLKAHELGWKIDGWKPTRCPKGESIDKGIDPEFNRSWCVIYGDMMCHVGGFTRAVMGQNRSDSANFEWAVRRIMSDGGAEFLLEDRLSYKYDFEREEEVAQYKMNQIFGVSADGRSIEQPQPHHAGFEEDTGRLGHGREVHGKANGIPNGGAGGDSGGEIPYARPCPRRQVGLA